MTYGQIRLRLVQLAPGVAHELIDGWIQDRYTQILDELPWKRLEAESIFQSPASYNTGTVTVTQGSTAIVGAGTNWTQQMTGLMIRINSASEFYTFTQTGATTGTLDRPFENILAGAGLSYRIDQAVYALPDGCRILRGVKALHEGGYPLELITPAELNRRAPARNTYGNPSMAAATWDNLIDPPSLQVELYPVPDCPNAAGNTLSFEVDYVYDPAALDPRKTQASLLPWAKPACLIAGVQSDVAANAGDVAKTQLHEARFQALLSQMRMTDHRQRGPQQVRLSGEYQGGHAPHYRRGPWHEGGTG